MEEKKQLYTLQEIGEKLGVSYAWLDKKIRQEKINTVWLGGSRRISSDELERIMTEGVK